MTNQTLKLGGGLRQVDWHSSWANFQDCDAISVMKAGKLRFSKPNKYWVESSEKRYVPHAGDSVLRIVVDSKADNFLVDIKGPGLAFLPVLAFEGGTRRNIPKFEIGTLLYVWVVKADPGMNPELSCTDVGKQQNLASLKMATCLNLQLVNASFPSTVIVVANAIMNSESLSGMQQRIMVEKLIQNLKLS
ncbi:hypothetical protein SO802_000169, partial [Lithocarpus litseifolius]